ncbi:unnamed protein product [Leptidea sinapis]|uniref:F5/8 type C domain-containing protein n=1 Tax=Leptidea sinapis TaxID=189913 RepID=A0A5E4Q9L4_9NEOP|nr:unnamed protein product [Leptidea sinapis]
MSAAQCIAPLGMESGLIPDKDLTASSSFNDGNVGPQNGRLNQDIKSGAWCPKPQITTESTEWLQINLHSVHKLSGNTNTYLEKKNQLDPPIWASKIRFIPYSSHRRTVCMRVELYGCYWSVGIVSYSMPKGNRRSNGVELTDVIYDGQWGDDLLRGGLGQLVDGQFGGDEIREAAKNSAWVGWRNDTKPPVLTFEFDKIREFSAVHLYCNNKFMRDVQNSRNVTIKLHHRIGKWVRIQLHFSARWILISEVVFDSGKPLTCYIYNTPIFIGHKIQH